MADSTKSEYYEGHAQEIEAIAYEIRRLEQENEPHNRAHENRLKSMRARLAEKLYIHLSDAKRDTMGEAIDGCALMETMLKCLDSYKKIEGRWFLSYFIKGYNKNTVSEKLGKQSCSVKSAVKGEAIRLNLRRIAKEHGMTAEEINKRLHKPTSSFGYIDPKAYSKYFDKSFIREFLQSLPRPCSDEEIERFIRDTLEQSYTESIEDEYQHANDEEQRVSIVDKKSKRVYDAATNEADGIGIFDEAYRIAASGKKNDAIYLRCFLTLNAMKSGTIEYDIERYIDMDFVERHRRDDYSASYETAKKEGKAQGKTIQKAAFFAKMRLKAMADEMGLTANSLYSYCKRARARTLDVAMKKLKRFKI